MAVNFHQDISSIVGMLVIVGVYTHHRWKRLDCFLFLASDAIKATAEGGRFQVRCSLSPPIAMSEDVISSTFNFWGSGSKQIWESLELS